MQSTTVRVNLTTHKILARLAEETQFSIQTILSRAVEAYRREVFLERANQAYGELRKDPKAWAACQEDRAAWDTTTRPPEGGVKVECAILCDALRSVSKQRLHGMALT